MTTDDDRDATRGNGVEKRARARTAIAAISSSVSRHRDAI
jgi:hypothetical protein